jgi:hypothetical protein
MTIRRWLGVCAAAVLIVSPAAAQQQSPEEVAQAYFAHFRAGEMDRVTALTHPSTLESFRTFMLEMLGDEIQEHERFGGRTDLATMPADSFYLAFIEADDDDDGMDVVFQTLEVQPLGHVMQGDSVAHVVYSARIALMDHPTAQTMVLTMRRHRNAWLVDPGEGMMGLIGGLMPLMMSAGMQAGMLNRFEDDDSDWDDDIDHDADMDEADEYIDEDEDDDEDDDEGDDEDEDDNDDEDNDEDDDDDDPPAV